ncbi:hypothetical protein BC938DRAFT_478220, partial [Jimgerdemannia flammicorona]
MDYLGLVWNAYAYILIHKMYDMGTRLYSTGAQCVVPVPVDDLFDALADHCPRLPCFTRLILVGLFEAWCGG